MASSGYTLWHTGVVHLMDKHDNFAGALICKCRGGWPRANAKPIFEDASS